MHVAKDTIKYYAQCHCDRIKIKIKMCSIYRSVFVFQLTLPKRERLLHSSFISVKAYLPAELYTYIVFIGTYTPSGTYVKFYFFKISTKKGTKRAHLYFRRGWKNRKIFTLRNIALRCLFVVRKLRAQDTYKRIYIMCTLEGAALVEK